MLGPVEFEDEVQIFVEEVDFHATVISERDRKAGIEFESILCLRQSLEPSEQEGLRGAAGPVDTFRIRGGPLCRMQEELSQRNICSVTDEALDTRGVISFPNRIDGKWDLDRPARQGAGGKQYRSISGV